MLETNESIFDLIGCVEAICVPTNGIVKKDGTAVMGAGLAKKFALRWPEIPAILGEQLKIGGNMPYSIGLVTTDDFIKTPILYDKVNDFSMVFSFPTKNHFKDPADLFLIKKSAQLMKNFADALGLELIAIPKVGTGLGGLSWEGLVKPCLDKILDDRFCVAVI